MAEMTTAFEELGINVSVTLDRFCGDAALLAELLGEFTREGYTEGMRAARAAGDLKALERVMHTAKGTAANLGLEQLSARFDAGVQAVRAGRVDELEGLCAAAAASYQATCEKIAALLP